MMEQQSGGLYTLVVSFKDLFRSEPETNAFTLGVEFGMIYRQLTENKLTVIETVTRIENREVLARAAAAHGFDLECMPTEVYGWDSTLLTKRREANPPGLRVVK